MQPIVSTQPISLCRSISYRGSGSKLHMDIVRMTRPPSILATENWMRITTPSAGPCVPLAPVMLAPMILCDARLNANADVTTLPSFVFSLRGWQSTQVKYRFLNAFCALRHPATYRPAAAIPSEPPRSSGFSLLDFYKDACSRQDIRVAFIS